MSKSIKNKYVKLDPIEHVLLRPNMYIGSIEKDKYSTWILDEDSCNWKPPTARPDEEGDDQKTWEWNEDDGDWEELDISAYSPLDNASKGEPRFTEAEWERSRAIRKESEAAHKAAWDANPPAPADKNDIDEEVYEAFFADD